jgi:ribose/xylose/arabinose/galactoside ABC-type transport system permease subunit/ABC-type multidrug transport system ATPase subunit
MSSSNGITSTAARTGFRVRLPRRRDAIPGEASGRLGLAVVAILLVAFFSLQYDNFLSTANGLTIALGMSAIMIAVAGSAALLISGNVDLSIGSMYALVAVTVAQVASDTQSTVLAVLMGMALGATLGACNGVLVRVLKLSPLIVTIGTLAVFRGLAFAVSDGIPVFGFPDSFTELGRGGFGQLTTPIIVAVVIFAVGSVLLVRTRTGLRLYAIGGDERAAALSGIPVGRVVVGLYALNGLLIGIAATLAAARLGSVSPQIAQGFELDVLTAAILGGVAFAGGSGRPLGVIIGVATIGILNAGLLFEGLADFYQQIAKGSLLLLALGADQLVQWRRARAKVATAPAREPALVPKVGDDDKDDGDRDVASPLPSSASRVASREPRRIVLDAEGLTVHYGSVTALADARITVAAGEILCLVGDNGAGKSTLIKVLSGAVRGSSGSIRVDGTPVDIDSPRAARAVGIETVYQDLALCPNLSVSHNLVLSDEPTRRLLGVLPVRDDVTADRRAGERLARLGVRLRDTRVAVSRLSGGQRQSVAIARAVHDDVRVVILDEPTAALGVSQTRNVLELVRSIAASGTGIIFITHDIETVMAIADRVLVMRLGSVAYDGPAADLDELELVALMAGLRTRPSASAATRDTETIDGAAEHA